MNVKFEGAVFVSGQQNDLERVRCLNVKEVEAPSEMVWWTAASVIKGREYKSPYDWCQLNTHHGSRYACAQSDERRDAES